MAAVISTHSPPMETALEMPTTCFSTCLMIRCKNLSQTHTPDNATLLLMYVLIQHVGAVKLLLEAHA